MNPKIKITLLLLLCLLVLATCKKYEEGPAFSLRSAYERVTGIWEITAYIVDGVDSTIAMQGPLCGVNECLFERYRHIVNSFASCFKGDSCDCAIGDWYFANKKKEIGIDINSNDNPYPFLKTGVTNWKIVRLRMKEMWITTQYNGKKYEIKFKKTREIVVK